MFNWQKFPKPIIGLAPMAEHTDLPFGLMAKKFGADLIYREMVSADAIIHGNKKTLEMLRISPKERPVIQQIFGRDPKIMAKAAALICKLSKPEGIDINMGCPARKVTKNFHGAALMRDTKLAMEIIKTVKSAVPVPVSIKTRLGWADPKEILTFAPMAEQAGATAICIHGRTKKQGYADVADWRMIAQVKKKLKIPVLANGSIFTPADILNCMEVTQADGVLIARGALGNPWIFSLEDKPEWKKLVKTILEHAKLQQKYYGDYGLVLLRKHLVHYLKGMPYSHKIKEQLTQVATLKELKSILMSGNQD